MLDYFNNVWGGLYKPGIFLSLDKAIIPSKIRHILKQYIKGKPHKWRFKLYVLACPVTGICLKVVFHDETHKTMVDKISAVVDNRF
jgi:hypothetical protein